MQRSERGGGWVGWLIFFLLIFGFRFLPPIANWLTQVTGITITVPMLIIAFTVLAVVVSIGGSLVRAAGRSGTSGRSRLPSSLPLPPQPSAPPKPAAPPWPPTIPSTNLPRARLPGGQEQLPRPPRFEPIIDPRIFAAGIAGLVILGALTLFFLVLAGALP
ncbi:MAG: hypothetical protein RMK84_10335 [Oscillochloridaceae bacterium]|nr:hypothetical protein [Chloroflexaceae bacterium]MDW8390511.1 hypothetical protein [Oscillochloridaceae bacterium]